MKSISPINPAITENMKRLIVKIGAALINSISGCVAQSQCIAMVPFPATSNTLYSIKSVPTSSTAFTQVSHQSHNGCTTNYSLCGKGEINGSQRRTKVSFSRTMMQVLELLRLAKRHILGQSDFDQLQHYRVMLV